VLNLERTRERFPILKSKIHLANCSQGAIPKEVLEALDEYKDTLVFSGMEWGRWMEEVRLAKEEFAVLIGASSDEVAVFSCVSDAVSAVASCLPIYGRKQIVTTPNEFPTVGQIWLASANRGRAKVEFVESPNGLYTTDVVEPYLGLDTAILSVHQVSYYNATLQDVRSLADLAHEHRALILVDAYQGLGTVPLDVKESDLDFVVSGNLKYLLGIPGIAFMYVRPGLSDDLQPGITGWFGRTNPFDFDATRLDFAPGARRFDMGTPPIAAAYAARAGMRLLRGVSVTEIQRHVQEISRRVIEGARERGLEVTGPQEVTAKGASTAIRVGDRSAEIEKEMFERGIIVSARADVVRFAPHFFTTHEDIETALDVLYEVL
jgi:selenocysteine lyase/cysteine desulfurase